MKIKKARVRNSRKLGTLKDSKTWAKAGVNAAAGAIIGATGGLGAGIVATATTSFGVSLAEDAIDGNELNIKRPPHQVLLMQFCLEQENLERIN